MHLPELDIQLPAFRLDVCMPGESLVQMEAKIFDLSTHISDAFVNIYILN
jgi:hypothetical protein